MDILDRVLISQNVYRRWDEFVKTAALQHAAALSRLAYIPDEAARIEADGTLTIYLPVESVEISMTIGKAEWAWREGFATQ